MPCSKVERPRLDQPFVIGALPTPGGDVPVVSSNLTRADRAGGRRVRWGIGRYTYTIDPGLYALGEPDDRSPVLVTCNYKLTFDALRRELPGRSAWILAVDTRGINVWCAAGKGTFSTDEVVRRIGAAQLPMIVSHNVVVLPQLSATGVSAPDVRKRSGFRAVFGPVRASDLPAFLHANIRATAEMRRVHFTFYDRLVLVPVEIANELKISAIALAAAVLVGGVGAGVFSLSRMLDRGLLATGAVLGAMIAGTVITPLLLPWVPGRMFSLKGALVGVVAGVLLVAKASVLGFAATPASLVAAVLLVTAGSSFGAMNFTGTSTYTSLHGVEKEMRAALPWQIAGAALAAVLWIAGGWI